MRIRAHAALGIADADIGHGLDRDAGSLVGRDGLVQQHGLHDLVADRVDRVQARHGLLEDHGDLAAADLEHLALGEFEQVAPLEHDAARVESPRWARDELHRAHGGHAFAAARLANDGERLARVDAHAHARHGLDARARTVVEADREVLHAHQRLDGLRCRRDDRVVGRHQCAAFLSLGSIASRMASPSML